jgi:hypothetical protein
MLPPPRSITRPLTSEKLFTIPRAPTYPSFPSVAFPRSSRGVFDYFAIFHRVNSGTGGFSGDDADTVPWHGQVGTDDLKPKKGADDGAGHGGRNWDLLPSLLIKLGIVQRDPDTVDVDRR